MKSNDNHAGISFSLTFSWRRFLSYRKQYIDWLCKSIDWFLYDRGLCHERVEEKRKIISWIIHKNFQNQPTEVLYKNRSLRNSQNFAGKHPCQSLSVLFIGTLKMNHFFSDSKKRRTKTVSLLDWIRMNVMLFVSETFCR